MPPRTVGNPRADRAEAEEAGALLARVRAALEGVPRVREQRMFSGITFMVNGKMCISAGRHRLMCRIDPERHETALKRPGARTVTMKGREYKGYVFVDEEAVATKKDLMHWVALCLDFNKRAQSSRARKKR
jgi:TfoX/Sxy family transcriptional regulator of competence genes